MAVFLTDGDQRATLAVTRALGKAGVAVAVGESRPDSLAGCSRWCARRAQYPSPLADPAGFQRWLLREMASGGYEVLLPMTDITTVLASEIRAQLEPLVLLPIPCPESIARAQDKRGMLLTAQQAGIACPKSYMLTPAEDVRELAGRISYPAVVKPRLSHWRSHDGWKTGEVQYAHSPAELEEKYRRAASQIPEPLVQEKVEGEGRGVFLLVWNGELKGAFCHRRLREKPPWGGVSVYRDSIPPDAEMIARSFELLKALGWQGVAMVEFKVDRADGISKLMEVNGRFWGSLQLAIDAGINFPLMLYRLAMGEDVPPAMEYRVGVKSRWLLGDLDHLLIRLRHGGEYNGVATRARAIREFLKFREPDCYYEVYRREDPGPGWFELKSYVRELLGRPRKGAARAR